MNTTLSATLNATPSTVAEEDASPVAEDVYDNSHLTSTYLSPHYLMDQFNQIDKLLHNFEPMCGAVGTGF